MKTSSRLTSGPPRGRAVLAALALTSAAVLSACGSDSEPADSASGGSDWLADLEPIALTVAETNAPGTPNADAWETFEAEVTEATDGKVTFENFFSSSLLAGTATVDGIGSGVADLGTVVPTYYPTELPVTNWLATLGAADFDSSLQSVLAGSAASYVDYFASPEIAEEFSSHNIRVLAAQASLPYDMLCNKPFESPEDASGLRSRSSGELFTGGLEALGVAPVSTEFGEIYESLQRGVMDCLLMNGPVYVDMGLTEVAQHYVPLQMPQLQANTYTINLDVWESFPPELQQVFHDASAIIPATVAEGNLAGQAAFAELEGVTYHDAEEMNEILRDHYEGVIDAMPESAPPAVEDPQAYVDSYLERLEEWRAKVTDMGYVGEEGAELQETFQQLDDFDIADYTEALREAASEYRP